MGEHGFVPQCDISANVQENIEHVNEDPHQLSVLKNSFLHMGQEFSHQLPVLENYILYPM